MILSTVPTDELGINNLAQVRMYANTSDYGGPDARMTIMYAAEY